jgi:hypothetical protein
VSASVASRAPPRFKLTAPVPLEDDLHVSVYQALRVLCPNDAVVNSWDLANAKSAIEGARKRRKGCLAGWPDLCVAWRSRLVLIELKRSRYGVISATQRTLHARLEEAGFPVTICTSVQDVLETVSRAGIPLRGRLSIQNGGST